MREFDCFFDASSPSCQLCSVYDDYKADFDEAIAMNKAYDRSHELLTQLTAQRKTDEFLAALTAASKAQLTQREELELILDTIPTVRTRSA